MNLLESAGFSRSNPYYIVKQGRVSWREKGFSIFADFWGRLTAHLSRVLQPKFLNRVRVGVSAVTFEWKLCCA